MKGVNEEYKKGFWTVVEDRILAEYVGVHSKGKWSRIPQATGLKRCGNSCRLRWVNYLSPNIKRGDFSHEEDDLIIRLHNQLLGNRVPGRTDNQVKNHWNTHLSKKRGFEGPRCRDNTRSVTTTTTTTTTTTSRHLPKIKHTKADKNAVEDDEFSKCARPTSQRGTV